MIYWESCSKTNVRKTFQRRHILEVVSQDDATWWQAKCVGDTNLWAGLIPSKQFQERWVGKSNGFSWKTWLLMQRTKLCLSLEVKQITPSFYEGTLWVAFHSLPPFLPLISIQNRKMRKPNSAGQAAIISIYLYCALIIFININKTPQPKLGEMTFFDLLVLSFPMDALLPLLCDDAEAKGLHNAPECYWAAADTCQVSFSKCHAISAFQRLCKNIKIRIIEHQFTRHVYTDAREQGRGQSWECLAFFSYTFHGL